MRISPRVKPHVREEAQKIAFNLEANIRESAENSLTILGFLLLLSAYGLVSYFRKDELFKQLESAAQHKQAVELFRTLGFVDKIFGMSYLITIAILCYFNFGPIVIYFLGLYL